MTGVAIHGHSSAGSVRPASPTYSSWANMKQRCLNPKHPNYPRYGGRGITVCDRWLTFANFLADMGERPEGMTLDRIDSAGNYEPGNCRWATRSEQNANRRGWRVSAEGRANMSAATAHRPRDNQGMFR